MSLSNKELDNLYNEGHGRMYCDDSPIFHDPHNPTRTNIKMELPECIICGLNADEISAIDEMVKDEVGHTICTGCLSERESGEQEDDFSFNTDYINDR